MEQVMYGAAERVKPASATTRTGDGFLCHVVEPEGQGTIPLTP
jgi:hypothetical protein